MKKLLGMMLAFAMMLSLAACGGGNGAASNELAVSSSSMNMSGGKMTVSFQWEPEEGMIGTFDDSYELLFNRENSFDYQPYASVEAATTDLHDLKWDEETTFEIDLKKDMGLMDSGYYCLVKKFSIETADGEEIEQEFRLEFEI